MRLADVRTDKKEREAIFDLFEALWIEIQPHHEFGTVEDLHPKAARVLGLWLDRYIATMLSGKSDNDTQVRLLAEFEERFKMLRSEADTEKEQQEISAVALLVMASFRAWRRTAWSLQQPWGETAGMLDRESPAGLVYLTWACERYETTTRSGKIRRVTRPHVHTRWLRGVLTDLRVWSVDEIGPQHIDRILRGYPAGIKRERALAILQDFFGWCEAHGHIDRSPVRKEHAGETRGTEQQK